MAASMKYEWDELKNKKNYKKHGVYFEEACTVFADLRGLEIADTESSSTETRYVLLGMSSLPRLLTVIYCERGDDVVRIICARNATTSETKAYEKRI